MPPALDHVTSSNDRKLRIARLAPTVLSLAYPEEGEGCPVARSAVNVVVDALVGYIKELVSPDTPGAIVIGGGLGVQTITVDLLRSRLRTHDIDLPILLVKNAAESGAISMARTQKIDT